MYNQFSLLSASGQPNSWRESRDFNPKQYLTPSFKTCAKQQRTTQPIFAMETRDLNEGEILRFFI